MPLKRGRKMRGKNEKREKSSGKRKIKKKRKKRRQRSRKCERVWLRYMVLREL